RIVGLSATVSNAAEIAEWLDGTLIATTWRPSRLTWQLPMIPASSDRTTDTALRARVAIDLAQRITDDGGSVLVFCGTKPKVRATALALATVLQMFGRAGRIGAGEHEGWAYLLTTELERANWQGALVDGYTVYSQIHASLPDHVLAEVLQGRITTIDEAEQWWLRTLC